MNASGTNWDTLVPFYLMAYRATPHGTSGYSPYYLLHGREMILPTSQDLRAKLSPDVRESECANRLENLKSTLKTAYKSVRENNYYPQGVLVHSNKRQRAPPSTKEIFYK